MKSIKRKGFTLVELLIVIVVIGILSAMMMLSSTEAVTSARASNIVSNLRNFKTAALAYYVDNMDKATAGSASAWESMYISATGTGSMDIVAKYMNNNTASTGGSTPDSTLTNYGIACSATGNWFVFYKFPTGDQSRIKEKIKGRAQSVGIYGATDGKNLAQSGSYENEAVAGMWVVKP